MQRHFLNRNNRLPCYISVIYINKLGPAASPGPIEFLINIMVSHTQVHFRSHSNKRQREWSVDLDPRMEESTDSEQVIRVARRVYVGNLAWKTSWQQLKVRP